MPQDSLPLFVGDKRAGFLHIGRVVRIRRYFNNGLSGAFGFFFVGLSRNEVGLSDVDLCDKLAGHTQSLLGLIFPSVFVLCQAESFADLLDTAFIDPRQLVFVRLTRRVYKFRWHR
jgi:hypothetical protein